MSITEAGLRHMGFVDWPEELYLSAEFHLLHVYQARGIVIEEDALPQKTGVVNEDAYQICFGNSVNAICQRLVNQDFSDDAETWAIQKRAKPPFFVIHFGPVERRDAKGRFLMEGGNQITTYSVFARSRMELNRLATSTLPSILVSQSLAFRTQPHDVNFSFLDSATFGLCKDGKVIHDAIFTASVRGYGSGRVGQIDMDAIVSRGTVASARIDRQFAIFYKIGSEEMERSDWTLAFIHFFLSIEMLIKAEFSKSSEVPIPVLLNWANLSLPSAVNYLKDLKTYSNLRAKFLHCVFSVWQHLDDFEYLDFVRIKKFRDDIAHGERVDVSESIAEDARRLALKLMPPLCP